MTDYQDQEQRERDFDAKSDDFRIELRFSGTYWKEEWSWGVYHINGGTVRSGVAESHDAAAMCAHVAWLEVVRGE